MCNNGFVQKGQKFKVHFAADSQNSGVSVILLGILPESPDDDVIKGRIEVAPNGADSIGPLTITNGIRVTIFITLPKPAGKGTLQIFIADQQVDQCQVTEDNTIRYEIF
jgi:hypothetical protein